MSVLTIHHRTIYRYRTPMVFGPHRLMLRPRESHALRLYEHEVTIAPSAVVTWAHDVAGNSVATASFSESSDTLSIDSFATLLLDVDRWPVFDIAASAQRSPFLLSEDDMTDLGALACRPISTAPDKCAIGRKDSSPSRVRVAGPRRCRCSRM